jgi:hypothetical protein
MTTPVIEQPAPLVAAGGWTAACKLVRTIAFLPTSTLRMKFEKIN